MDGLQLPKNKVSPERDLDFPAKETANLILRNLGMSALRPALLPLTGVKPFIVNNLSKAQNEAEADLIFPSQTTYDYKSWLGLPVWDSIKLTMPQYNDNQGNLVLNDSLTLDVALFEITNSRNIITTSIAGRNGTVKEYMSDGDYNITIKGVLTTPYSNVPPLDSIFRFKNITSAPIAIEVESNLLNMFEIYSIVITNPYIAQREGMRNVFDITLECLSDYPSTIER
jgi:hypothetical protein